MAIDLTLNIQVSQSAGANITSINKPTGVVNGDFMLAGVIYTSDQVMTPPAGWTEFQNYDFYPAANEYRLRLWYKRASSEGTSYSWSTVGAVYTDGFIWRMTGVVSAGSPLDAPTGSAWSDGSTIVSCSAITTATAGAGVILVGATSNDYTSLTLSTLTERLDDGITIFAAGDVQAVAGSSGAKSATLGTERGWGVILLALKPEPDVPVVVSVSMSLVDTGGTGNYTSLTTWESTEEADLTVGDGCQKWVYCKSSDGVADTARCRVLGWVMASGKGVVITSTGSDRHNGVWDDTKYRNVSITADLTSMVIYDTWVTIDGLQLWGSSSQALDFQTGATDSVGNPIVKNCILRGSNTLYINIVSAIGEPGQFYKIYNNIIYDAKGSENTGILISIATLATASVYNNTIINCNRGIRRTAGDAIVINNLITGSADGDVFIGTYDALSTNNSSNQTDNPGGTNYASQTFTFVDRDADNFCLAATDAGARDIGADLSANAFCSFSVDIIGTTRPYNTVWDIGAFEYTAGTPSVILPKVVFQGIGTARFRFR